MKVVFDLVAQKIVIEGDSGDLVSVLQAARDVAPSITEIQITTTKADALSGGGNGGGAGGRAEAGANGVTTMKQFVRSLTLKNVSERICAIGYYIKTRENIETFSPKDMDGWFTNCGLPKPAQMPVAIFDAKRKYRYLESGGHGKWRLTSDGENIVVQRTNESEAGKE